MSSLAIQNKKKLLQTAIKAHKEDNIQEAIEQYEAVLLIDEKHVQTLCNLGLIYKNTKKYSKALSLFKKAHDNEPTNILTILNYAKLYRDIESWESSIQMHKSSIHLAPNDANLFNELAISYEKMGDLNKAITNYKEAIRRDIKFVKAYNNIGVILYKQKRYDACVEIFEMAKKVDENHSGTYLNLGAALNRAKRYDYAKEILEIAVELDKNSSGPYTNLGNVLNKLDMHDRALECHQKALQIDDCYASNHANIAITYKNLEQYKKSKISFEKALSLDAKNVNTHFDYATLLLLTGEIEKGFEEYEWRLKKDEYKQIKNLDLIEKKPRFTDNIETQGKKLLIYGEQGFGDNIQFIRYGDKLKSKYPKLYIKLECRRELKELFESIDFVDEIIVRGDDLGEFHCQMPIMSLPNFFRTTLKSIPSKTPYLKAQKNLLDIKLDSKKINIGLVWGGSNTNENHKNRVLELEKFLPILNHKKINVYSLQIGSDADEIKRLKLKANQITDLSSSLTDFSKTASVIEELDLVISSDTSVVHLCGSLKKPVWTMLQKIPDWRWLQNRKSSPWYKSVKLFRQKTKGEWSSVYEDIFKELEKEYKIKLER